MTKYSATTPTPAVLSNGHSTVFYAEPIFRAACHNIPLGKAGTSRGRIHVREAPSYASECVSTAKIHRFYRGSFEDYITTPCEEPSHSPRAFDAAWLDFNGQLTEPRLAAITRFWERQVRSLLVVTLFTAHMSDWMWGRVRNHGGIEQLLNARLDGSEIESVMRYGDGAPMIQVALRRAHGQPRLVSLAVRARATTALEVV